MPSCQNQKQRSTKGRLQSLPEMALEIQVEIYQYLESCDLFHLSRTCKRFRAFFLNRNVMNEKLWMQARVNTDDLPERPPFMSEPAFIHLLYSPYCHRCGCNSTRTSSSIWDWFTRCCHKCLTEVSVSYKDAQKVIKKHFDGWASRYVSPIEGVLAVVHTEDSEYERARRRSRRDRVHQQHLNELLKRWSTSTTSSVPMPRQDLIKIARDFGRAEKIELTKRKACAKQCKIWHNTQKARRINEIIEYLIAKGWEKEVEDLTHANRKELSQLPLVNKAAKLTTAECYKACASKKAQQILNETRQKRLTRERTTVLLARFDALEEAICRHYIRLPRTASMEFRPRGIDFVFTDECKALLDAPTEQLVTAADFVDLIPCVTAAWEATQREQLAAAVRQALSFIDPDGADVLDLAIVFFPCPCGVSQMFRGHDAKDPLRYPAILGHNCLREKRYADDVPECDLYSSLAMYRGVEHESQDTISGLQPFDVKNVPVSKEAMRKACDVIRAMGYDPTRTTMRDLQGCDVLLTCVRCGEVPNPRFYGDTRLFTWDAAIRHLLATMTSHNPIHDKWAPMDDSMLKHMCHRLEESDHTRWMKRPTPRYNELIWSCSLCIAFDANGEKMEQHLTKTHLLTDINNCVEDGTIYDVRPSVSQATGHAPSAPMTTHNRWQGVWLHSARATCPFMLIMIHVVVPYWARI
ncbi:hypothetical protein C8Q73DRAFT_519509 [Cubamyces lactineus]|nr:hypothetical protein C8Q73DRAFT_519509 [Cubamyces lactineus]